MPFEALVGVDHEKVGGDSDFVRAATLGEDVSHGGMVVKVSEGLVRLPYVTLDVIVQLGGCASKGPEVWVGNLVTCGGSEVFDPIRVEDVLDVNDPVSLEGLDLFFGQFVFFGGCDTG